MPYPPFPWKLKIDGTLIQTLQFIDVYRAQEHVSEGFEIISFLPGKTLGGIYYACYGVGSDLQYNELGVFPAYVKYNGKYGVWVSHMYVDNLNSVAGGREELGLPKEMAQFKYESSKKNTISVYQGNKSICSIIYGRQLFTTRKSISGGAFGIKDSQVIYFNGDFSLVPGITRAKIRISSESPLSDLHLNKPLITFCAKNAEAEMGINPQVLGHV